MKLQILNIKNGSIIELDLYSIENNMAFTSKNDYALMFCLHDGYLDCRESSMVKLTEKSLKECQDLMMIKNIIE